MYGLVPPVGGAMYTQEFRTVSNTVVNMNEIANLRSKTGDRFARVRGFHVDLLRNEFSRRKAKNNSFSKRAFAKRLHLHFSALCRILNRKQSISLRVGLSIAAQLNLSDEQRCLFMLSIADEKFMQIATTLSKAICPDLTPDTFLLLWSQSLRVATGEVTGGGMYG